MSIIGLYRYGVGLYLGLRLATIMPSSLYIIIILCTLSYTLTFCACSQVRMHIDAIVFEFSIS